MPSLGCPRGWASLVRGRAQAGGAKLPQLAVAACRCHQDESLSFEGTRQKAGARRQEPGLGKPPAHPATSPSDRPTNCLHHIVGCDACRTFPLMASCPCSSSCHDWRVCAVSPSSTLTQHRRTSRLQSRFNLDHARHPDPERPRHTQSVLALALALTSLALPSSIPDQPPTSTNNTTRALVVLEQRDRVSPETRVFSSL